MSKEPAEQPQRSAERSEARFAPATASDPFFRSKRPRSLMEAASGEASSEPHKCPDCKGKQGESANVHIEHYFPKGYNPNDEPWKSIKAHHNAAIADDRERIEFLERVAKQRIEALHRAGERRKTLVEALEKVQKLAEQELGLPRYEPAVTATLTDIERISNAALASAKEQP